MLLSSVLFFLAFVYAGIMLAYWWGWKNTPEYRLPANFIAQTRVTVLVPARNEARHIQSCLAAILNGNYPRELLEVVVIDDFSTDDTADLVRAFAFKNRLSADQLQLLTLADHLPENRRLFPNKKQGIELALKNAKGAIIATTDADCLTLPDWLNLIVSTFQSAPALQMLTGPVLYHRESNLLSRFQSLDVLGMAGITAAGIQLGLHRMGNGANLAYRKTAFEQIGGYSGNRHIASGDDMFLLQKMAQTWPAGVGFLKSREAVVLSTAQPDWAAFFRQRLRWGAKNPDLPEWPIRLLLLAVLLNCWGVWIGVGGWLLGQMPGYVLAVQVLLKGVADFVLLRSTAVYFKRLDLMRWFLPSLVLHTAYIALVGSASIRQSLMNTGRGNTPSAGRTRDGKWFR